MNHSDPSSSETVFIAQFADESAAPESPRFGIMDLMMLTAGMAIAFAIFNQLVARGWYSTEAIWFKAIAGVAYCLSTGLSLAAIYRFVVQKKTTGRFLVEPGHWVLLATLFSVIGHVVALGIMSSYPEGIQGNESFYAWVWPYFVASFVGSIVFLWGAIQVASWWKAVFVVNALLGFVHIAQSIAMLVAISASSSNQWDEIFGWVAFGLQVLSSIGLLTVIVVELGKGPRRDLWHWFGVLVLLITCVILPVVSWVYVNYLLDPTGLN